MRQMLRFQVLFWAGFATWNGTALAQQANNPSDQFGTLGRRATTINQDVRQGPSNGTIVNQNNGGPTGNNLAGNGAGGPTDGPSPATFSQGEAVNPERGSDVDFARRLVEHGFIKAELGKLAVDKGQSEEVRNIGQAMISDHTRWAHTLEKIASENNFKLPTKMPAKYKSTIDRLSGLSGTDFDLAFTKEVARYQEADLVLLRNEAAKGTVAALQKWSSRCIPGLERRLEMVRDEQANATVAKK